MESRTAILALCAFLAFVGTSVALPGVRGVTLTPASVYVNGTQDMWVNVTFNISYVPIDGVNLANFSVSFKNNQSTWTTTNCTNNATLPAGWTPTFSTDNTTWAFANQTCTFRIANDTDVGLWELSDIVLVTANGTDFQPTGIPLLTIVNVQMDTPLCLPPTIYVTKTSPDNRIRIQDFPMQPSTAVLDDSDETVNFTVSVLSTNGVNVSQTQWAYRPRGEPNSTNILYTIPCGSPNDSLVFNGTITCQMILQNSTVNTTLDVYELMQLRMIDSKGNEWNSDKLDLLRAINADMNDIHLAYHVNAMHGSVYHSHLCALPILTVVNELTSCNPVRLITCMMSPLQCDATSNPPCPSNPDCRLRYRFAICAVQYNCYDALNVWCNGGFFNQNGCGTGAENTATIGLMCKNALYSNCRPNDLTDCLSDNISPPTATSCQHRQAFNGCVVASHCAALIRDVSDCKNQTNDLPFPPLSLVDEFTAAYYMTFADAAEAHKMLGQLKPRLDAYNQRSSVTTLVAIFVAVAVVAVVGVAVVVRRRRTAVEVMDQELL